jgi:hypothetical protein
LSQVSTLPAANLLPVSKKRHQGQFAAGVVDTISGFRDIKVNLKVKMFLYFPKVSKLL